MRQVVQCVSCLALVNVVEVTMRQVVCLPITQVTVGLLTTTGHNGKSDDAGNSVGLLATAGH